MFELLRETPQILYPFAFGLGLIFGSFVSMLIYRLYHDESGIVNGRSKCPSCNRILTPFELIPLFSWIIQGGKCKKCGKKISPIYPLIELSFALFLVIGAWYLGLHKINTLEFVLIGLALILFWYDVWFMTVDRRISFPAIALAVLVIVLHHGDQYSFYLAGGALGGLFYFVQYFYSKGAWVGFGDVELGIFMGLVLGPQILFIALFGAYILGTFWILVLGSWYFFRGKKLNLKGAKLPMGAFLMPSLILFMLWGEPIWEWYWGLILI